MSLGQIVANTDTGRKRRHNEDAYVCDPPLFAIADGMGGAQAGEVASRLAVDALDQSAGPASSGEEQVVALIQKANRRIYEQANAHTSLSGMGTTLTLALVDEGRVAIGHVGDSRAYLIRNDTLEQLTDDHSLVAELTRAGKLSEEEAETHPQRSVITRALGTDPDVDVDAFTIETREGDVFMLCSDGLTAMVEDGAILETIRKRRSSLDRAVRELVKAANRSGGEDNITVILFEIAEQDTERANAVSAAAPEPDHEEEDTLSELDAVPVIDTGERVDDWSRDGDAPAPAASTVARRRGRRAIYWIAGIAVLLVVAGLAVFGLSEAHFVGAQKDGHVAVYQGVPYDIAGVHLYRTVYISPLLAAQLTQSERQRLFDHDLRSYGAARATVRTYEGLVSP